MRDDFTLKTIDVLAKRVGFICSNPECKMVTIGPNSEKHNSTSIGVAAHISAASAGGPRYDSSLTGEERQDIDNAIWLCQSCSRLIDHDTIKYTIELLKKWKINAEQEASEKLNRQLSRGAMFSEKSDLQEIKPNGYYEKEFYGQKVRYYLDGKYLHIEHEPAEGVIGYYVLDEEGNMVDYKWPYPLEEYDLFINPELILKTSLEILPDGKKKKLFI